MNRFHQFRRFDGATLVAGLFLLVLMAGCVNVNTSCGSCCGKDGGLGDRDGACNPSPPSGNYTGSADGFYNTATGLQIPAGSGLTCASGKTCAVPYGRCASGTPCKRWYNPNGASCKCDCNP